MGERAKINLTPKRLRALRLIQQRPGMHVCGLIEVCDRVEASWSQSGDWSGFDRASTGAQAATQWGAAYSKPLIEAGLVRIEYCTPKYGRLYLTSEGRAAIFETEASRP